MTEAGGPALLMTVADLLASWIAAEAPAMPRITISLASKRGAGAMLPWQGCLEEVDLQEGAGQHLLWRSRSALAVDHRLLRHAPCLHPWRRSLPSGSPLLPPRNALLQLPRDQIHLLLYGLLLQRTVQRSSQAAKLNLALQHKN